MFAITIKKKKVIFMINYQEYIATKLKKTLEKMINLSTLCLNNLIAMIIGIYHTTIDDRFVIL